MIWKFSVEKYSFLGFFHYLCFFNSNMLIQQPFVMKRIIIILTVLSLYSPFICGGNASPSDTLTYNQKKMLNKRQRKDAREWVRVMKASGYELIGHLSLEEAVLQHMQRRDGLGPDAVEFLGRGNSKSKNNGIQMAKVSIASQYADRSCASIKGRLIYDSIDEAMDRCLEAYGKGLLNKIRGILEESFSIYKGLSDGRYDVQSMFIIDEKEARKVRIEVMEKAIAESSVGPEYAEYLMSQASEPILNRYDDLIDLE